MLLNCMALFLYGMAILPDRLTILTVMGDDRSELHGNASVVHRNPSV